MHPSSCHTFVMFCLIASPVMDIYGLKLAFIYDDGLEPNSYVELWVARLFDDTNCSPFLISFTSIEMSSAALMLLDVQQIDRFDGVVLAAIDCKVGDVIESIVSSTKMPVLRLEFRLCPPSIATGLNAERLQLYRLNETYGEFCCNFAISKWLEERICWSSVDNETRRMLLSSPFREVQGCAPLDQLQWSQSDGLLAVNYVKRKSVDWPIKELDGKKLRLTLLEEPPFVIIDRHPNGTVKGYKGYCLEIVAILQQQYNLTYEIILPGDNAFGKEMPDGSWNGMIGLVADQTVDIGLGPFSVTHPRSKVVDFSVGFYEDGNTILIPPPAEENRLLACLKPFRLETWITLMQFAIILPFMLWLHSKFYWIHYQEKCPTLGTRYLVILATLIGQSGQKLSSKRCSLLLLAAVWYLSAVVFASAYIGILMSFLRFPKFFAVINQLEELPGSNLKWVVLRATALDSLFLDDTANGVYKTIGDEILKQKRGALIDDHLEGVDCVADGGCAYIAGKSNLESSIYDDYLRTSKCRISIAKQEFFKVNVAFAFSKNSPLKPFMDQKILQMIEAGLVIHWKEIYGAPTGDKCGKVKQSDTGPKSLSLVDLQGAFIILAIGSGLASLGFLLEHLTVLYRSLFCFSFFTIIVK